MSVMTRGRSSWVTISLSIALSACAGEDGPDRLSPTGAGGSSNQPSGGTAGAPVSGSGGLGGTTAAGAGGSAGSAGLAGSAGSAGSAGFAGAPLDCGTPKVAASPLRRMTRREYNNVVRDLLEDTTRPADQFVPESAQSGFTNGAESTLLSPVVVDDFERAATAVARAATTAEKLPNLVGCDPNAVDGQDACAAAFIRSFGARAFRRTLEEAQVADYQALYATTKASETFAVAIELVIRAMLQSPYFLYRLELGTGVASASGTLPLTPEETAARLSFLLWGSIPDPELRQAVAEGKLSTPADVRAQAARMLAHTNGSEIFNDFHVQWGQLETLPNLTKPEPFNPTIGRLLIEETKQFIDHTLRRGDGLLSTLLTSPVTYLNKELADYYGVSGSTDSTFQLLTMPAGQRAGLLTHGSFMGNFAHGSQPSPVLRGKFILTQLACSPPEAPPDDVDTSLPAPDPTKTARQQLVELTGRGICVGCHALLNPPGFAFEHFDGLGRYRTMDDRGLPVDPSAVVDGPGDMGGTFTNHEDFLLAVANSQVVRSCLTSKWFIYAHGRVPEDDDACSLSASATNFGSTGNVRELILSITESPAFLYYRPSTEGVAP
jgi:hypothetical protein